MLSQKVLYVDNHTVYLSKERSAYNVGMYDTGIITDQEPRGLDRAPRTSRDRRLEVQDKVPTSRLPGRRPVGRSGPTTRSGACLSKRDRPKPYPSTSSDTDFVRPIRTSGSPERSPETLSFYAHKDNTSRRQMRGIYLPITPGATARRQHP